MTNNLSPRDLEALSAYLDGQSSGRQLRKLEARLNEDDDLKAALAALRRTRGALRELPQMRAPRQFTLTPEMAGQQTRTSSLYPTMRLVSALSTMLLVVVILGDFITSNSTQFGQINLQAPAIVEDNMQSVAPTLVQAIPSENVLEESPPEAGAELFALPTEGSSTGEFRLEESADAPPADLAAAPTATQSEAAFESAPQPAAGDSQGQPLEEPMAQATQDLSPTASVLGEVDSSIVTQAAGADDGPAATQGFFAQPPADKGLETAGEVQESANPFPLPLIRIVEIVLAVLALSLSSITLYLRRRT